MVISNLLESLTVGQALVLIVVLPIVLLAFRCLIHIGNDEEKRIQEAYYKMQIEREHYNRINRIYYESPSITKPTATKHIVLKYEHCPNCGASMHSNKCEYCDSEF